MSLSPRPPGPPSARVTHRFVAAETLTTLTYSPPAETSAPSAPSAYIAALVDAAPPLTAAQRDRLAALLRGGGSDAAA